MERYLVDTLAKYTAGTLGLAIGATWTAPIWERSDVQALALAGVHGLTVISVTAGGVLAVGYTWNRLATWAAKRPPVLPPLSLPAQFAHDQDARVLLHEEALSDDAPDYADAWKAALIKFALVSRWGGFGWRAMCRYVGRKDWRQCVELMVGGEVLVPGRGNRAPDWSVGWSYSKFRLSLKYGRLALPFPADCAPPVVSW